jgi:hypothetical protein
VIRDVRLGAMGTAAGLSVANTATASVQRTLVTASDDEGLEADGMGCSVDVSDSVVRDLTSMSTAGRGLVAREGGSVRAARVRVERIAGVGAYAIDVGSTLQMTDSVVSGVGVFRQLTGPGGSGISALEGGSVDVSRVLVTGSELFGVSSAQSSANGTQLTIRDSAVIGTTAEVFDVMGEVFGAALSAADGASLVAERTFVDHSTNSGVYAFGTASSVALHDVAITNTGLSDGSISANALVSGGGAIVDAERVLLSGGSHNAVFAISGASASLTDVIVENIAPSTLGAGVGLIATGGAGIDAERLAVIGTNGAAMMAIPQPGSAMPLQDGAHIAGHDVYVSDIRTSTVRVAPTPQPHADGRTVAYGAHAAAGSRVQLERFVLANGGYGFVVSSGAMSLRQGIVTGMLDAAGANSVSQAMLVDVAIFGNARDSVVHDDGLPEGSVLAPPAAVCPPTGCM